MSDKQFVDRAFLNPDGSPNLVDYNVLPHLVMQEHNDTLKNNIAAITQLQELGGVTKYFNLTTGTWDIAKIGDVQTGITNNAKIHINGSTQKEMVNFPTDGTTRRGTIQLINASTNDDDEVIINDINIPFYHEIGKITRCTWEYDGVRLWIDSECDPEVQQRPIFDLQPASIQMVQGEETPALFEAAVRNAKELQWLKDGVMITGKKGANLIIPEPTEADMGDYSLQATGYNDVKYFSQNAYFLDSPRIPSAVISDAVSNSSVNAGSTVTFSVAYSGYPTPTIQLLEATTVDGIYSPIDGGTSTPFTKAWTNTRYTKWQVGTGDDAVFSTPRLITAIKGTQSLTPTVIVKDTENYLVMAPVGGTLMTALEGSLDVTAGSPVVIPLVSVTISGTAYWGISIGDINLAAGKAGLRYKETDLLNAGDWATNSTAYTASYITILDKTFNVNFTPFTTFLQDQGTVAIENGFAHSVKPTVASIAAILLGSAFPADKKLRVTIVVESITGNQVFAVGNQDFVQSLVEGSNVFIINSAGFANQDIIFQFGQTTDIYESEIASIKIEAQP